jgi:hypothetical protein
MAVPSSGVLRLGGLAFEKLEDDYNDGLPSAIDTSYGPFSLRDMTLGGATTVNAEDFDPTNGFSVSRPDNIPGHGMSEWYSYDHDYAAPGCNIAYETGGIGTFTFPINLGSAQGTVTVEYQSYAIPDKFVLTWNGNTYTSGTGNGNGGGFVGLASQLSALQATAGNANATLTTLPQGIYTGTSGPQGQRGGRGRFTFNKNASQGSCVMTISAPLTGTGWWFSVSCPGNQVIGIGDGIAPSLTTSSESSITTSGFTMNGNVSSKGLTSNFTTTGTITARGFVYHSGGASGDYVDGQSGVTTDQADTTNATGNFSEAVTGLSAGTVYKYRAYATNSAGTTYATEEVVTTASTPSRTAYWTSAAAYPRPSATCGITVDDGIAQRYYSTNPPAVNTYVYTHATNNSTLGGGHYGYQDGALQTNRRITVDGNGKITAHSNC